MLVIAHKNKNKNNKRNHNFSKKKNVKNVGLLVDILRMQNVLVYKGKENKIIQNEFYTIKFILYFFGAILQ